MNAIAQTLTRPAHDGRLLLEVTVEGGHTHIFEVDAEPFYRSLAQIMRAPASKRVADAEPEVPPSSFDPVGGS